MPITLSAYAQHTRCTSKLYWTLLADATVRSAKFLHGSFAKKTVKGRDYW